jgi:hypothetical protein
MYISKNKHMKNIIRRSVQLLSGIILFASCSKSFIEKQPFDSLPDEEAIVDESSMENAVSGMYANLRAVGAYGRDMPVIGDVQSDNAFIEASNSGRYIANYQFNFTSANDEYTDIWNKSYTTILRANRIIDADISGGDVPLLKAQAYAVRGLMYFKLVNIYARPYTDNPDGAGVPVILHYDPYTQPERNTVKEVYAQIISDLEQGFATADGYSNSITLSKYAIEGLLARAYLYMGDKAKAKAAAVDVINNSEFSLVGADSYNDFWKDAGVHTDGVETMFEVDVDLINNNGSDDFSGIYADNYQDIYCTQELYNLYSPTDVRASVLIPDYTKAGVPAVIVYKFPNAISTKDRDNIKVIRLSEVYLIAAEASLPGNETDARNYLNAVAVTRDPDFSGYTSSGNELLEDIITERRKELAFEGDRFYDLNRLKRTIAREADPASIPGPLQINYDNYHRVAPIPLSELQANPNIDQNPGYQ